MKVTEALLDNNDMHDKIMAEYAQNKTPPEKGLTRHPLHAPSSSWAGKHNHWYVIVLIDTIISVITILFVITTTVTANVT